MPIIFTFDEAKAAQSAAFLLRRLGPMTRIQLLKLMYLADRRALIESGRTITGDRMVSMPLGPVLSATCDLLRGRRQSEGPWAEFVRSPKSMRGDALYEPVADRVDLLSRFHLEVLEAVAVEFGAMELDDLLDYCHTKLPEYTETKNSRPIDPADILRAAGLPEEFIEDVAMHAMERQYLAGFGDGKS